jgi:hypothetical protein
MLCGLEADMRSRRCGTPIAWKSAAFASAVAAPLLIAVHLSVGSASAAQSDKRDLIARATAYVGAFIDRFTNIVAEEHYVQQTYAPRRRREMRSDFLLVKPPGLQEWYQFRDVFEVDGSPVRDRQDRLARLFLERPADALARGFEVTRESARYNLEDVGTLNKPLMGIVLLQQQYVSRFRFTTGPLDKAVGAGVRVVQYNEWVRPTILKAAQANGDLPAKGRHWIEEGTGRVMKSEIVVRGETVVTTFRFDDDLQIDVPMMMEDNLGTATYSRFRRFGVQTEERVSSPGSPH